MKNYKFSKYNQFGRLSSGNYLLYNLFSSSVVILSEEELKKLQKCSESEDELLSQAVHCGFVVPSQEDELSKLVALRNINNFSDKRAGFQILPTTECNARCFYCYEKGFISHTMTTHTVDSTIGFIKDYCRSMEEINITWFGGEPFVCENIIRKISGELIPYFEERGTRYNASVITNGALLNDNNIADLSAKLNIRSVQITLDGKGDEYLRRKAYIDSKITYEQILNTIAKVSKSGVEVLVRINADRNNRSSCLDVIEDLHNLDADFDYIRPYVAPLYSTCKTSATFEKTELADVYTEVFKKMIDFGFIKSVNGLPMNFSNATCCAKAINNFVIAPNGNISKCEHLLDDPNEQIGTVFTGLCFNKAFKKWTNTDLPEMCMECDYLPICQAGCYAAETCKFGYGRCPYIIFIKEAIIAAADYLLEKGGIN